MNFHLRIKLFQWSPHSPWHAYWMELDPFPSRLAAIQWLEQIVLPSGLTGILIYTSPQNG